MGGANKVLGDPAFDSIVVTDTVPPFRLDPELLRGKVRVLDTAKLFADAIRRIAEGGSITELLGPED
jgi:ribose-phosphate pyrophosphokinase